MTWKHMTATIDTSTKVNVGILTTILGATIGGAVYLTKLDTGFTAVRDLVTDVKIAVQNLTTTVAADGKTLITVEQMQRFMQIRLDEIDVRLKALEKGK